jgi:hypothetical protein
MPRQVRGYSSLGYQSVPRPSGVKSKIESAGRVGARLGKRSELTIIVPLVPGGAKRLRTFLQALGGNLAPGASKVGTLHDMRFVFFDNDKLGSNCTRIEVPHQMMQSRIRVRNPDWSTRAADRMELLDPDRCTGQGR